MRKGCSLLQKIHLLNTCFTTSLPLTIQYVFPLITLSISLMPLWWWIDWTNNAMNLCHVGKNSGTLILVINPTIWQQMNFSLSRPKLSWVIKQLFLVWSSNFNTLISPENQVVWSVSTFLQPCVDQLLLWVSMTEEPYFFSSKTVQPYESSCNLKQFNFAAAFCHINNLFKLLIVGFTTIAARVWVRVGGCFTVSFPASGVLKVADKTGHNDTGWWRNPGYSHQLMLEATVLPSHT